LLASLFIVTFDGTVMAPNDGQVDGENRFGPYLFGTVRRRSGSAAEFENPTQFLRSFVNQRPGKQGAHYRVSYTPATAKVEERKEQERNMNVEKRFAFVTFMLTTALTGPLVFAAGPDVIVGFVDNGGQGTGPDDQPLRRGTFVGLTASTNSCNIGDDALQWRALPSDQHPVISLNLYRLTFGGRMEQIAKSWVKHGFFAVNATDCASITGVPHCERNDRKPDGTIRWPQNGSVLIPGCSDLYSEDLNDRPDMLGPRSKINPTTGKFDAQQAMSLAGYPPSDPIDRVMTVDEKELSQSNAKYFLEAQYITADDAAALRARNNTTYREVVPQKRAGIWYLRNVGNDNNVRYQPAITAWATDGAQFPPEIETDEGNPGKSYIFVGYKISGPTNGIYRYEYAVYNMNSDLAIKAFSLPLNGAVDRPDFKGIDSHGEIWSNEAWDIQVQPDRITWSAKNSDDPNANAIRWGTTYNFGFESASPPSDGLATLSRFKPGTGAVSPTVARTVKVPR
jgi:hypothetical protein